MREQVELAVVAQVLLQHHLVQLQQQEQQEQVVVVVDQVKEIRSHNLQVVMAALESSSSAGHK